MKKICFLVIILLLLSLRVFADNENSVEDGFAEAFAKAESVSTWFTLFSNNTNDGFNIRFEGNDSIYAEDVYGYKSIYEEDLYSYGKVAGFKNIDELKTALLEVFSEKLADGFIARTYNGGGKQIPHFIEYNGALYFKDWAYMGSLNRRPEMKFETVSKDGKKTTVRAYYTDANGTDKTYDYKYETVNGNIIFTSFVSPKELYYHDMQTDGFYYPEAADGPVLIAAAAAIVSLAGAVICRKKIKE